MLGQELVTNGTFDDGTGWTLDGGWAIGGGNLSNSGVSGFATISIGSENDKVYRVVFDRIDVDSFNVNVVINGGYNATTNEGLQSTFDCTAGGNSNGNFAFQGTATMVIDNLSVRELLPGAVRVTWIDSVSAAAIGNKIYRDDVEIADVANGIQFYSDPDAPAGTESKYEVQAYSATDETTQEVLGVNVQYITTA